MGFEYKIIAQFTEKQITEIQEALEAHAGFGKKYEFDTKVFYNFRLTNNKGKIPNMSISFENDGIYICRYDGSFLWKNFEELKEYMEHENINYTVLDYQE